MAGTDSASEESRARARSRSSRDLPDWLSRLGVLVTAVVLLRIGFELWWTARVHEHLWAQAGLVMIYALAIVFLLLTFLDIDHRKVAPWGLGALFAGLQLYTLVTILVVSQHYTSDALLFVHEAAAQFLAGHDPYTVTLAGGYEGFQVPYYVQTPTSTGGMITNLNYPALSFLVYTPFVAMGIDDLRVVSAGVLLALVMLIYLAAPRGLKLLSVSVLFLSSFFLSFSLSGFDILFIFFLAGAVVLWPNDRRGAGFFYGLACAVKQTVWFIAPFLIILHWREDEARGLDRRARLQGLLTSAAWALVAFVIPNLPFLLEHPVAWFQGVLTPFGLFGEALVPLSQGLTLPIYTGAVHVNRWFLRALAGSALIGLLLLYWTYFDTWRAAVWVVPPVVLAFAERSLQNYFEMFYPIALLVLLQMVDRRERHERQPAPAVARPPSARDPDTGEAA